MHITLVPILLEVRQIYEINDRTARFHAYISLAKGTRSNEAFPLGMFSPMGQRQRDYIDELIAMDAKSMARETAELVAKEMSRLSDRYRLMIVPVDEPRNGWTERNLSDADWRFSMAINPSEKVPQWVTIQL
jgi:hypothetical protein